MQSCLDGTALFIWKLAASGKFLRLLYFHRSAKVSGVETSRQPKIPIAEFKELLGPAASGLSDSEIERLRDLEDRLADFVFDSWLRNRNPQPGVAKVLKS